MPVRSTWPLSRNFGPDALKAKAAGFKAYKIHPGNGQHKSGSQIPSYLGHIDEIKEVRKAVGDDFTLLYDAVQRYNYYEAIKVGRALDEYGYVSFEDPMQTYDIDGLVELRKHLDVPRGGRIHHQHLRLRRVHSPRRHGHRTADHGQPRRHYRSFRVGQLADTFGMPCTPHNWGTFFDLAAAFQIELALPNCYWFEMVWPWEYADRPYVTTSSASTPTATFPRPRIRHGVSAHRAALDKIMVRDRPLRLAGGTACPTKTIAALAAGSLISICPLRTGGFPA